MSSKLVHTFEGSKVQAFGSFVGAPLTAATDLAAGECSATAEGRKWVRRVRRSMSYQLVVESSILVRTWGFSLLAAPPPKLW